jgi:hypothetical protein
MHCHQWWAIIWNKEAIDEVHFNHSGIDGHDCCAAGICPLPGRSSFPWAISYQRPRLLTHFGIPKSGKF